MFKKDILDEFNMRSRFAFASKEQALPSPCKERPETGRVISKNIALGSTKILNT